VNPESQALTDEELARQSQAGSLSAFEQLVYRYEARLCAFIRRWCPNETDARETTQDTFVRAFQAIGQYQCRYPFRAWLFAIARRQCIDRHRAARQPCDGPLPELPDANDPAELLARQEARADLWQWARRVLPLAQYEALWLHYAEDLDIAQTARILRKTQTHVKVLLFRARRTLAREMPRPQPARQTLPKTDGQSLPANAAAPGNGRPAAVNTLAQPHTTVPCPAPPLNL
jgi:RNA polymerase sigma-70 factor (ECF subfamily)